MTPGRGSHKSFSIHQITPYNFERHYTFIMVFAALALMVLTLVLNIFLFRQAQIATIRELEKELNEISYRIDTNVESFVSGVQKIQTILDKKIPISIDEVHKTIQTSLYQEGLVYGKLPLADYPVPGCLIYGLPYNFKKIPHISNVLANIFFFGPGKLSCFLMNFPEVIKLYYSSKQLNLFCPWHTFPPKTEPDSPLNSEILEKLWNSKTQGMIQSSWDPFMKKSLKSEIQTAYHSSNIKDKKLHGVFTIALSNDFFTRPLSPRTSLPFGQAFLIDQNGTVFAHMVPKSQRFQKIFLPQRKWPAALRAAYGSRSPATGKVSFAETSFLDGYWTCTLPIKKTPWQLVFVGTAFESSIDDLSWTFLDSMIFLIAIILLVGLSHRLVNIYFLKPAARLIHHLNQERQGNTPTMDLLPARWRPWAELISQTFAENRALVHELETRVQARTAALKEALEKIKTSQKQIIAQEKLASMGTLVAGIAHEIKNPLNFVINFADISRNSIKAVRKTQGDIPILKNLSRNMDKIIEYAERADHIIKSMLLHARSGEHNILEEIDLNQLLQEYTKLCQQSFMAHAEQFPLNIETKWDTSIEPIHVYVQDIGRIFLNLLNNALQAVYDRFLKKIEGYNPCISITTQDLGTNILITIEDNGGGIPEAIVEKIFDPFFTTKDPQKGTGLGLSLSYDCVQRHSGHLEIENKPGKQVKFLVTIPKNLQEISEES